MEPASGKAGYTLLELLVALAILGALAGLAAPPFIRMIEQQRRVAEIAQVERTLAALPMQARERARDLVLRPRGASVDGVQRPAFISPLGDPAGADLSALPQGWTVEPASDLWIRYDGVCYGGAVRATGPDGRAIAYRLSAPICRPDRIAEAET